MEARNAAVKQTILSTVILGIMMAIFYASAGRTDIPRSWFLIIVAEIYFVANNLALYKYNPGLLIQRLKIKRGARKRGTKCW